MAKRDPPGFKATDSHPVSGWQASTLPGDARSSGFAVTHPGTRSAGTARQAPTSGSPTAVMNPCQGGVVLRAAIFVHTVLAVGLVFAASSFEVWLAQLAVAASVAMPAVLLWLVSVCLLKDVLVRLPDVARWLTIIALGACATSACWGLQAHVGLGLWADSRWLTPGFSFAPTLAGAAFSVLLYYWLRVREKAQAPADTNARLAELQSRIRPHFLFNTLNTAIALARIDAARTEHLLEDLSELFRVALAETDTAATLGSEIDLAQRYLAIEKLRFGDRLEVCWEIDPVASGVRVPRLLLQPLLENAVRHGVEPSATGGQIRVRTSLARNHAMILITNSVSPEPSRPGTGMALRNLRERLHLMYDVAANFEARLEHDVFRVQISVPLKLA